MAATVDTQGNEHILLYSLTELHANSETSADREIYVLTSQKYDITKENWTCPLAAAAAVVLWMNNGAAI